MERPCEVNFFHKLKILQSALNNFVKPLRRAGVVKKTGSVSNKGSDWHLKRG